MRELWWRNIAGPRKFIETLSDTLLIEQNSVLLARTDTIPWESVMRQYVEEALLGESMRIQALDVSGAEDCAGLLLERFCPSSRYEYNERVGNLGNFIKAHRETTVPVVWVRGVEDTRFWLDFLRQYKSKGAEDGLFVLELPSAASQKVSRAKFLHYDDFISDYDVLVFALMACAEIGSPMELREYIAYTVAALSGNDVQDALAILESVDFAREYPADPEDKAKRQTLWKAQIQTLFPALERERAAFVDAFYPVIESCLPYLANNAVQFPYDAELGHIVAMTQLTTADGQRRLLMPPEQYRRLHFLRDLRNKLAHSEICRPEEAVRLLTSKI